MEIEDFEISYSRTINTTTQPLPPNTEVRSPFKLGDSVSLYTEDYFTLKLSTSAEVVLSTKATDALRVEDIPNIIEEVRANIDQIDELEADETTRKQYNTIW